MLARIANYLFTLIQLGNKIMTALDNLNTSIAALAAQVTTLANNVVTNDKAIQTEIAALVAAMGAGNDAAVQAAADQISQLSATIGTQAAAVAAETDTLTKSLPPSP